MRDLQLQFPELDDRPRLKLVAWRPMLRNTLRGFADVELPIGLVVRDCPVHVSRGRAWAALPGRPQIDAEGRVRRDERGRIVYAIMLSWTSDRLRDAFSDRVVELVAAEHPEVFRDLAGEC